MQGVHAFDPKAKTVIDLESFVADDHLLRRVDRLLQLSFVREPGTTTNLISINSSASGIGTR